jgi:bacteriocin-like protein
MAKKLTKEELEKISGGELRVIKNDLCLIENSTKKVFLKVPLSEVMQHFSDYKREKGRNDPRAFDDWFKHTWVEYDDALNPPNNT